jgi:hypothetical protein
MTHDPFDRCKKAEELGYEYWPPMLFGKPGGWYKKGTHDETDECYRSAADVIAASRTP